MVYRKCVLAVSLSLLASAAAAQFRLPSFDIAIKGGFMMIADDKDIDGNHYSFQYEAIGVQGEINVHIGQRLSVGWFYNRKVLANYHGDNGPSGDRNGQHLMYGPNLRLSGGRAARLRPYLQVKYFWLETVVEYPGYRVAADLKGCGGGVGLMLRASNKLYINLIEGEINMFLNNDKFLFQRTDLFPTIRAGLTYNISKRK
jgi:hypothetical protein